MSDEMDEIWALYADDGAQSLQAAEESLIRLKADASDHPSIAALFRALHTFKGNSRLLGLTVIESRAHIAEDIVGLVRDEGVPLDAEMLELLFEATDALRGMLDEAIVSRLDSAEAPTADLVSRMTDKFERCRLGHTPSPEVSHPPQVTTAFVDPNPLEIADDTNDEQADVIPNNARTGATRLGDDPLYFEIFLELAGQTLTDVEAATDATNETDADACGIAREASIRLRESAERIDLEEWAQLARDIGEAIGNPERLAPALDALRIMHADGLRRLQPASPAKVVLPAPGEAEPGLKPDGQSIDVFLSQIKPHLTTLANVGGDSFHPTSELVNATEKLAEAAKAAGYERLAEVAALVSMAHDSESFDTALFDLYHIVTLLRSRSGEPHDLTEPVECPSESLATWCGAKAGAILGKLALAINGRPARELDWQEIGVLVRNLWCIFHARRLETACHVTSALQDLIARVHSGEMPPDPPLLRVLFSFVEAGKPLLLECGSTSEASVADLLQRTSDAMDRLCLQDADPALGGLKLPPSFSGVLSRESLARIQDAISEGRKFFLIRADTEGYPDTGAAFIDWLSKDAQSLASVTVFRDNGTLFDFLVSTCLEEPSVIAALSAMDPSGEALTFHGRVAVDDDASSHARAPATRQGEFGESARDASPTIIESVGEIITAHATLRQSLLRILDDEALRDVERSLVSGRRDTEGGATASQAIQNWKAALEQLLALEEQISGNLEHLQREFVASRLLCSAGMLKELEQTLITHASDAGVEINLLVTGVDEWVDADILNQLNRASRPLLTLAFDEMMARRTRKSASIWDVSISLDKSDKRVALYVESRFAQADATGDGYSVDADMLLTARALRARGGDFERRPLSDARGVRYVVSAPQSMVVLDGMIMRVGGINYVVPVESIERIVHVSAASTRQISADGGGSVLRLDQDTMAPIVHLCGEPAAADTPAERRRAMEENEEGLFIIATDEGRLAALPVDELLGQQPLLVRPLKGFLSSIARVNGCASLGDGGVGMVINPAALF